jgi:hypothetical protein
MSRGQQPARVTGPASYFPSIEKTYGRPIQEWLDMVNSRADQSEHGMGHGHANALVAHARTGR